MRFYELCEPDSGQAVWILADENILNQTYIVNSKN